MHVHKSPNAFLPMTPSLRARRLWQGYDTPSLARLEDAHEFLLQYALQLYARTTLKLPIRKLEGFPSQASASADKPLYTRLQPCKQHREPHPRHRRIKRNKTNTGKYRLVTYVLRGLENLRRSRRLSNL